MKSGATLVNVADSLASSVSVEYRAVSRIAAVPVALKEPPGVLVVNGAGVLLNVSIKAGILVANGIGVAVGTDVKVLLTIATASNSEINTICSLLSCVIALPNFSIISRSTTNPLEWCSSNSITLSVHEKSALSLNFRLRSKLEIKLFKLGVIGTSSSVHQIN